MRGWGVFEGEGERVGRVRGGVCLKGKEREDWDRNWSYDNKKLVQTTRIQCTVNPRLSGLPWGWPCPLK